MTASVPAGPEDGVAPVPHAGAMGRDLYYTQVDCGEPLTYDVRALEIPS